MKTKATIAAALLLGLLSSGDVDGGERQRDIGRTTEKEVNVVLSSGFATILISKGESGKVIIARPGSADETPLHMTYAVRNRVGYLEISIGEGDEDEQGEYGHWSIPGGTWELKFCDAIPLSFDIELGIGKGLLNLTGLQIKDFTLSAGASEVTLDFDRENSESIEHFSVESGLAQFTGRNLGNANFKQFRFEGGVGNYYLDFGGNLNREVDVDVEVGLGVLTIVVPPDIGARLVHEKSWISHFDCDKDFAPVDNSEYITENYHLASGRMNIRIESGLGSVKIRRR
jgi:hypothetical protein